MPEFLKTKEEYEAAIKEDKLTVIDFTATWCPPCQMIGPLFEEFAGLPENSGVAFFKLDVDENEEGAGVAGISAMPTF